MKVTIDMDKKGCKETVKSFKKPRVGSSKN